jgi:hypothetical protein
MSSHVHTRSPFDVLIGMNTDLLSIFTDGFLEIERPDHLRYRDPQNLATDVVPGTLPG